MEGPKQIRTPASRGAKEEYVRQELEGFREKALEFGASAAEVIPVSFVSVDERVRMKCLVPRCPALRDGGTPYCPPHSPELDFMRKVFSRYRWAVLFKIDVRNDQDYIAPSETQRREQSLQDGTKWSFLGKSYEIVGRLELYVQSEGYGLALGFGGGSCKGGLCHGEPCAVFQTGTCRFPLLARPSMESVGIDVSDLVSKVGWDIVGMLVGIVFVC